MSDLILNLDTALQEFPKRGAEGSKKHQRFVKCRRFLEKKGFLRQKQLPTETALPKRDASRKGREAERERGKKRKKADSPGSQGGAGRAGGFGCGPKMLPKKNATCGSKTSETSGQSGISATPSKTGSSSARPKGTQNNCSAGGLSKAHLWSEYDSGLSSAAAAGLPSKMVAIDCEMVGTGPGGRNSDLARCSIVGYYGDVIYDKYIRPVEAITNYRTRWSGIRRHHMMNAVPFKAAQKELGAER
uniref:Uncharacterized protein n=1 Tax=Sphaerodactylus townsendi TaxID=933632 RepID=A0ACB8G6H9_9SAUR